ncbi:hypothetical protein [Haloarchaeobius amylolyticus]|uniref:hypothetical protein n=1 Tax=Haloarchaeobius amylolyticus TaxID=1198296 RepID=UPI002270005A|nr:hypothetical protein [Haloarchaeobius amylolyticus]
MENRPWVVLGLVLTVVLAGCAGFGGVGEDPTGEPTTDAPTSATDSATEGESTTTTTATTTGQTATPTASAYEPPAPPNVPTESKMGQGENRIRSVELINKVNTGDGVSDFDLRIQANTMMKDVDPAKHGDVEGEPYFMVAVDGTRIERSDYLAMKEDGEWVVQVHPGGLEKFDEGQHEITVWLFDQDSNSDDVYGKWTGSFQYEKR